MVSTGLHVIAQIEEEEGQFGPCSKAPALDAIYKVTAAQAVQMSDED
jgi:hypothetical protein